MIDSSVLIAVERGKLDLERVLRDYGDEPVAIAAVTASELLHGVHRAVEPSQRNRHAPLHPPGAPTPLQLSAP